MNPVNHDKVIKTIQEVLKPENKVLALHEPYFVGNEWTYVKDCLDTAWVSYAGKYVDEFENKLADFTGMKHAIVVVNGTVAIFICLKLIDTQPNEEVLVPDITFVATANAVAHAGAIPHFVDIEERTLGINPFKLEEYLTEIAEVRDDGCYNKATKRRIKAVIPVHIFGHPVDIDPLLRLCDEYKLELIEDAAESIGSYYKGVHTGKWGKVSALSFNGNKTITTGGGGAIITDNDELAHLAKHLTTTAKVPHKWAYFHDMVGYNFRLPNINAAVGCAQMEQLPTYLSRKRALAERYIEAFEDFPGLYFFQEPSFAKSNYWLNAIVLNQENKNQRERLLEALHNRKLLARPLWTPMHELPMYQNNPKMENLDTAKSLAARLINIPSSVFL